MCENSSKNIFIIDSFSSDKTVEISEALGAKVYQRAWKNYADQFQWGLDKCPIETEWVMRMDADEYIEPDLISELPSALAEVPDDINGFYIRRKYSFTLSSNIPHFLFNFNFILIINSMLTINIYHENILF